MVMTMMAMIFSEKEYHWMIFVLILPLIRHSVTDFDSFRYSPSLMAIGSLRQTHFILPLHSH